MDVQLNHQASALDCHPTRITPEPYTTSCGWWAHRGWLGRSRSELLCLGCWTCDLVAGWASENRQMKGWMSTFGYTKYNYLPKKCKNLWWYLNHPASKHRGTYWQWRTDVMHCVHAQTQLNTRTIIKEKKKAIYQYMHKEEQCAHSHT